MTARRLLVVLLGGGALLAAVLVAGGYNVSAAAGHFPPVAALLHLTMHNSVALRAGAPVPGDLGSERRVRAGAAHYDLVCRDCHGAPGVPLDAVARSLEPRPPHIVDAVPKWQPEELFWIVKHGIKMTAMPAWPSQHRDDEVWSMVAFLQQLPGMDAERYRRLVGGATPDPLEPPADSPLDAELARCARCHGYGGEGLEAAGYPRLDILPPLYIEQSLEAFARGERASGIMQAQASAVPRRYLAALARHYGNALPPAAQRQATRGAAAVGAGQGEHIARHGLPERGVPPCAACHGPASYPRSPAYPTLAGQRQDYLETQLRLFQAGHRGGTVFAEIMRHAAAGLEPPDIAAVARYYATLGESPDVAAPREPGTASDPGAPDYSSIVPLAPDAPSGGR